MSYTDHLAPLAGHSWPAVSQDRIYRLSAIVSESGSGYSLPGDYIRFLAVCDGASYKAGWDWDAALNANGMIETFYGVDHNPGAKEGVWIPLESLWAFRRGDILAEWMFPVGECDLGFWAISVRPSDNGSIYYIAKDSIGSVDHDDRKPEHAGFSALFEAFLHGYSTLPPQ